MSGPDNRSPLTKPFTTPPVPLCRSTKRHLRHDPGILVRQHDQPIGSQTGPRVRALVGAWFSTMPITLAVTGVRPLRRFDARNRIRGQCLAQVHGVARMPPRASRDAGNSTLILRRITGNG